MTNYYFDVVIKEKYKWLLELEVMRFIHVSGL